MIEGFCFSEDAAAFAIAGVALAALLGSAAMRAASACMKTAWSFNEIFLLNLKVVFAIALVDFLRGVLFGQAHPAGKRPHISPDFMSLRRFYAFPARFICAARQPKRQA